MDGYHPMQEKLDIKILILFILRRLPDSVEGETLSNLAMADGTVGYFEYAECLSELEESGHVERSGFLYKITDKGIRNCDILESSLPYTVRSRLEKKVLPLAEGMRRRAMIGAAHEFAKDGWRVNLSLADGMGEILSMRLLCGSEAQAEKIKANFRARAEQYYNEFMEKLLED